MTHKEFYDAIYHLEQLGGDRRSVHWIELERLLLKGLAQHTPEENGAEPSARWLRQADSGV